MKKNILFYAFCLFLGSVLAVACAKDSSTSDTNTNNTGTGGSTARFSIVGDFLYTVDNNNLKVFRINEPTSPIFLGTIPIGVGIETIFSLNNNLLVGASDGMYIYDIAQPQSPVLLTKYTHIRQCDPVVANDTIAYVTLRSTSANGRCGITTGPTNVLEVVDIRNASNPNLIRRYNMTNPYGLGIDKNLLFVCDAGVLRVMDISNPYTDVPQIASLNINLNDVIPLSGHLLAVGDDAVYDIDYTEITNMRIVAKLKRNKESNMTNPNAPESSDKRFVFRQN
jgi:hypothetical protein